MRKVWDIHGGVHPPQNKTQSNQTPIATIPLPNELIVPLNQHIGAPALLLVQAGEKVLKGQKIAEAQGFVSAAVHAPSSGTITAVETRPLNHASGLEGLCAILKPDGEDRWIEKHSIANWRELDKTALVELIRDAGIAGMGGAGFPTAVKMSPRADQVINTLIINGTECEPYITADDVLMREHADEIIKGVEILAYLLNTPKKIIIGVEDNKPEAAKIMEEAASNSEASIELVLFPTKYPSGGEKQLIQILTGKEVPSGKIPADIGIVLQNVGTARAVYRAVCFGEPLIDRVTTVVGEALQIQQNIHVLIGTPISHVLKQHGFSNDNCARLIIGGPMMGYSMSHADVPIIKTTNCVLVPSHEEMPSPEPAQACIRCGMCAEACPASLLPQQLYWFSRSENFDQLRNHSLFDCIECGACSFVCPSNIPLVQYYRASKGAIRHHDDEKQKAEYSRKRFEFRKARIEKADAEKEAKRQARKQAAEAAKAKLAENAKNDASEASLKNAEPSPAPKAKPELDPAKTLAKLERALSSAKSRVDRSIKALSDAKEETLDESRVEALAARVKQAEQKAAEAEQKLKAFAESSKNSEANASESDSANDTKRKTEIKIHEKLNASPEDQRLKNIQTLEKRLTTAKQKVAEAELNNSPTLDALKTGVDKLTQKLIQAKAEQTAENNASADEKDINAADLAIAKAKARAESLASMSAQEKAQAKLGSLKKRLEKAEKRLKVAVAEGDENVEAFKTSVEKLQAKIAEAEAST